MTAETEHSPEPVMISALQHYSYCPRQYALIHVEQTFTDNIFTLRGRAVHEQVDKASSISQNAVRVERALPLYSEQLGLVGKADVVEFDLAGTPYPIEYKHGSKRAHEHDELQLAAQALCLEEMTGKPVLLGAIYHHSSRRRREVKIDKALRQQVVDTLKAIRQLSAAGFIPPPINDDRCRHCSLIDSCQPAVVAAQGRLHQLRQRLFDLD